MLKNYLKIALRNLRRHKGYTFINLAGLAVGMACCITVLLFVQDEVRYDGYHTLGNRLYRISSRAVLMATGEENLVADSPFLWGPAMKREYPEIAEYARFSAATTPSAPWEIRFNQAVFRESRILYADASVFDLFNWPLLQGSAEHALLQPQSLVLSESMARKYFGGENAIGKILRVDPQRRDRSGRPTHETLDYKVTGVMKDIPRRSHFTADFLLSFVDLTRFMAKMSPPAMS